MTNAYAMRNLLELHEYNTMITREAFNTHFTKTRESIRFTFNGWDGKSYDGESRIGRVYRTNLPGYEEVRLIKVGKHLCYIDEERMITEKATGEQHPEAEWLVEVERAKGCGAGTEQRKELMREKHDLPSRFWEPQPDEEDLERIAREYTGSELDDEPLPFE